MNLRKFSIYSLWSVIAVMLVFIPAAAYADTFSDAQKDYIYGDYQDSISKLARLKGSEQVTYLMGLNYLKMGDYTASRSYFLKIVESGARGQYLGQAKIKYADSYFLEKNFSRAKQEFRALLSSDCAKTFMPLLYLRLAQIASKEGDWDAKKSYLDKIKTQFPDSAEMKYVGVIEGYGNYYTVQVGAFGTMDNAQSIKSDLGSRNDVYVVKELKGAMPIYKVRVGKFSARLDAEKLCARLVDDGYPAIVYP